MSVNAPETVEQPRGFQIGKRFYPAAVGEKLGDPSLVAGTTGLTWDQFQSMLGIPAPDDPEGVAEEHDDYDQELLIVGLVTLAVARGNPLWPRPKVISYVMDLDSVAVELVGLTPDEPETGADGEPLPPTLVDEPSSTTTASGDQTLDETPGPSVEPLVST